MAYLDHELSPEAHASAKKHLKDCAACGEALASLERASRMFEELIRKWNETEVRVDIDKLRRLLRAL